MFYTQDSKLLALQIDVMMNISADSATYAQVLISLMAVCVVKHQPKHNKAHDIALRSSNKTCQQSKKRKNSAVKRELRTAHGYPEVFFGLSQYIKGEGAGGGGGIRHMLHGTGSQVY